jgi:hypothetical protein
MKQVLLGGALESVLAAAAERPPSEDSPRTDACVLLVGLRRSFTARLRGRSSANLQVCRDPGKAKALHYTNEKPR